MAANSPNFLSMPQLQLAFDKPRSRSSDPASSKMAAAEMERSGALGKQRQQVLEALRVHGPCTSAELAFRASLDRHAVARRLPELREMGLVFQGPIRNCSVGRPAVEWGVR